MTKSRLSLIRLGLIVAATTASCGIYAQSQPIRVTEQAQQTQPKPGHGQSMEQVEAKFGQPSEKFAPVGDPPITRWRYQGFTVYFEHDKVIHAVSHRS